MIVGRASGRLRINVYFNALAYVRAIDHRLIYTLNIGECEKNKHCYARDNQEPSSQLSSVIPLRGPLRTRITS
jgi:hypothetical protein